MFWLWACGLGFELEPRPSTTERPLWDHPIEPIATWSSDDRCRISSLFDRVRRKEPDAEGWVRIRGDLDGVRRTDELRVLREKGKGYSSTYVELKLDGRPWLKVSAVLALSEIMHELPFPEGGSEAELKVIEGALFGRVCDRPDPSLQLLIDDTIRWVQGPPELPPDYVVREEGRWRFYNGDAHRSKGSLPVTYPRPITEVSGLAVVSTGQGVIAERAGAHAWLFVSRNHVKLRWPSEFSARIRNTGVEVTRHPTTMDEIEAPITIFREL